MVPGLAAASLAFLAGVLALLSLPGLPRPLHLAGLAAGGLAVVAAAGGVVARRHLWYATVLAACAVAGFALAAAEATRWHAARWPEARAGERLMVLATVDSIPVRSPMGWSFDAEIVGEDREPRRPLRVRVAWKPFAIRPHAGERWRLMLSLRPPRGAASGTFDPERQLFLDRIHALASVVPSRLNERLDDGHRPLTALRERIALRIAAVVADREAAALIAALAVGADGDMSREQWRVFNATGTTHLVAISGLHVTLFAVIALAAARRLWGLAAGRLPVGNREPFSIAMGLAAAAAYSALAGLSVPTQRTLLMLGAWLGVRALGRFAPPAGPLWIALVAVLLVDPLAPLAAGFWLSFGAIAAILFYGGTRIAAAGGVREAVALQGAVGVALAPLTLAWFGSVSLAGFLVNLVAIPVVSFAFVPAILAAMALMPAWPGASDALLRLAGAAYDHGWPWLTAAADAPLALLHASPPPWWYGAAAVATACALLPWPWRLRVASVAWLVPLAVAAADAPAPGTVQVAVLDVGEGRAVIVRTARHTLLYDTGDVFGSGGRVAASVVVPYLREHGVERLDVLALSHLTPHAAAGATALLAAMPVERAIVGGEHVPDFAGAGPCRRGQRWEWDGVAFTVLHPVEVAAGARGAASCVLHVAAGGTGVLLPGDVDRAAESALVARSLPPSPIVLAPRRGSDTASSPGFVAASRGRLVVLSGSRDGRSGPKPAVARWEAAGATVLDTRTAGTLVLEAGPGGWRLAGSARTAARRVWSAPP